MVTLSDCVFALTRREFAQLLHVCEDDIRPDTPLTQLIATDRRRDIWNSAQRQLGWQFPELELPAGMVRFGWGLSLASSARTAIVMLVLGAKWVALPLALGTLLASASLYRLLTRPWRTELPRLETFGDLSRALLARNMHTCRDLFGLKPTREEIFAAVSVILEDVGADPKKITPDTPLLHLIEG
jgi:hypothetical protein